MANVTNFSLALNVVLALSIMVLAYHSMNCRMREENISWNGGHPTSLKSGSCVCSSFDAYCMCTPSLAIDLVIVSGMDHLWLVRRKDTNQFATMGGFVMVGETIEETVRRELKEETGIELEKPPTLFGVYSDPRRDNRRHTVSAVYAIHLDGHEHPVAADDIKEVKRIAMADIEKYEYFADHKTILKDYRLWHMRQNLSNSGSSSLADNDFAPDIARSLCVDHAGFRMQ